MQTIRYHIAEIAALVGARRVSGRQDNAGISRLLTDSRNLSVTGECLFFALVSARNDGHKYIEALYKKGLQHFVVQYIPEPLKNKPDIDFLVVEDTLDALQQLAAAYRNTFSIPVVGITGSNGKTIVKEWLAYLLMEDKKVVKSPKSYNSQIGVPLSVWEMLPGDDIAIFEAGLSQPGEMEHNQKVIRPTIGIFTNVGAAHDEHFTGRRQKIKEKLAVCRRSAAGLLRRPYRYPRGGAERCGVDRHHLLYVGQRAGQRFAGVGHYRSRREVNHSRTLQGGKDIRYHSVCR